MAMVMREVVVPEEFGKVGWVLAGPVGRRRKSLDLILSLIERHMPQRILREG